MKRILMAGGLLAAVLCRGEATRDVLTLVRTARDALFDLRASLRPGDAADGEEYPDGTELPLVAE